MPLRVKGIIALNGLQRRSQSVIRHLSVTNCRDDTGMTERSLNQSKISGLFKEFQRQGVSQGMGRGGGCDASLSQPLSESPTDMPGADPGAPGRDERGTTASVSLGLPCEIPFQ